MNLQCAKAGNDGSLFRGIRGIHAGSIWSHSTSKKNLPNPLAFVIDPHLVAYNVLNSYVKARDRAFGTENNYRDVWTRTKKKEEIKKFAQYGGHFLASLIGFLREERGGMIHSAVLVKTSRDTSGTFPADASQKPPKTAHNAREATKMYVIVNNRSRVDCCEVFWLVDDRFAKLTE